VKKRLFATVLAIVVLATISTTVVSATPGHGAGTPPIVPLSTPLPPIVISIDIEIDDEC